MTKFAVITDLHIGRPKVFMSWYDKFLFPTKEGVGGKLLESRLIQSVERINNDKTLDFVIVLGDYSEGDPKRSFEILANVLHPLRIMKGNHDPQNIDIRDYRTVPDSCFYRNGCNFIFAETEIDQRSKGFFSKVPQNTQDFLKRTIKESVDNSTGMSVIFSHSPIFTRIIGNKPRLAFSKIQKDMRIVNIAGHVHSFSRKIWNNGMIEQIVLNALFCHPSVYKFTIDGSQLSFELI